MTVRCQPSRQLWPAWTACCRRCDVKVKPLIDEVIELLERRELLASSVFIEKVGAPDERIVRDVASLKGEKVNYLSLLLVQNPKRLRGELRRGCRKRAAAPVAASEEISA